jgi:AraC-like DNA-binding protein
MLYRRFAPGPAAAAFVDHYWILEAPDAGDVQRVVPDGSPELIVHLGAPFESREGAVWREQPRAFLAGQLTGPMFLRAAGPARVMGATFRPDGLRGVLDARADELTGGAHAVDGSDLESVGQLEAWLVRRARRPGDALVTEAVRQIAESRGLRDIASLARDLGLSTRQLERRFREQTGLSPKRFARVRRFQSVFPAIEAGHGWASAAAACGYWDQAHLVRDFREFAGEPPSALMAGEDLARHFLSDLPQRRIASRR